MLEGVQVRRWPVLRDRGGNVRGYVQYASFDLPLLMRLLFTARPGLVVAEPPPTTGAVVRLACRLRRVPYVFYAADIVSAAARGIGVVGPVVRLLERLEGWVLRGAAGVLTVSEELAREIVGMGVRKEQVHVVGTGVDTDVFNADGPKDRLDRPTAVYAGTMSEIQGASVFVAAMARVIERVPGARLVMLGQGSEIGQLREMASRLPPGTVEFLGVHGGAATARWLRSARVAVASVRPERGYDLAFATKTFAATGCGTPVVYAGVGPCAPLVVGHDLGRAVPWEPEPVAEALAEALSTEPDHATRRRLADWTERNFSLDAVAARATKVLADAVR
jgi:glycosyltransferase involved in cell wall biosynthesis